MAVFRAAADGRRTAARLRALGHIPVLAPVIEIVPTGASLPDDTTGVLVFTSAHTPAALACHDRGIDRLRHLPCWCVGARTAEAARAAGFVQVTAGPGDAASLAALMALSHLGARVTLAAGRERKPDLQIGLEDRGIAVSTVEVYRAAPVASWTAATADALNAVRAALHYSHRSATLAYECAVTAGLEHVFRRWHHQCLSDDVASALRERGVSDLTVSARPDEEHLLATLPACQP